MVWVWKWINKSTHKKLFILYCFHFHLLRTLAYHLSYLQFWLPFLSVDLHCGVCLHSMLKIWKSWNRGVISVLSSKSFTIISLASVKIISSSKTSIANYCYIFFMYNSIILYISVILNKHNLACGIFVFRTLNTLSNINRFVQHSPEGIIQFNVNNWKIFLTSPKRQHDLTAIVPCSGNKVHYYGTNSWVFLTFLVILNIFFN